MKKFLSILTVSLTFLILAACSKENRIERNLWKKGGDWDITYYNYSFGTPGFSYTNESFNDCGNMNFNEDGTGTATFYINGQTEVVAFTYSNTEDKMTLVYDGSSAQVYSLNWKKNVITLEYDESTTNPDNSTMYDTETIIIKKK